MAYISQLDASIPIGTTLLDDLDNEVLGLKAALQQQFPNFGPAAVNATVVELNYTVGVTSGIQTQLDTKRDRFTYVVVTSGGTATSGQFIMANNSSSAFTYNLPADPTAGMAVGFKDQALVWTIGGAKNLTVGRNGKQIEGLSEDMVCDLKGAEFVLRYMDDTRQWRRVSV